MHVILAPKDIESAVDEIVKLVQIIQAGPGSVNTDPATNFTIRFPTLSHVFASMIAENHLQEYTKVPLYGITEKRKQGARERRERPWGGVVVGGGS